MLVRILRIEDDSDECFGSEGSQFETLEEAEKFLAEFWLPETGNQRSDYYITMK